ncbi:histidine phosphatase family protein [Dactylosporangium cerinum]
MSIEIVYETHALTEDNERGFATGWLPGRLSEQGRRNAADMGRRRRDDGIAAVFTSDLWRAVETAQIAFGDSGIPVLHDWRLRECDFGTRNGSPAPDVKRDRLEYVDRPYPGGESHSQALDRVAPRGPAEPVGRAAGPAHRASRHLPGPGADAHRAQRARAGGRGLRVAAGGVGVPARVRSARLAVGGCGHLGGKCRRRWLPCHPDKHPTRPPVSW